MSQRFEIAIQVPEEHAGPLSSVAYVTGYFAYFKGWTNPFYKRRTRAAWEAGHAHAFCDHVAAQQNRQT